MLIAMFLTPNTDKWVAMLSEAKHSMYLSA